MQEDYQLLGISKKQFNKMRKLCVSELLLRKSATALEIHKAIKEQTGSYSQNVGDTIRKFYMKTRDKRNREAKQSRRWDYRPYTKPSYQPIGAPHPEWKKDDGFYTSRAWRELRLMALDIYRVCQACGAGSNDGRLHVDHVIPRYKDPSKSLQLSNLQVLCEDCNVGKGAWSQADFRQHFKSI